MSDNSQIFYNKKILIYGLGKSGLSSFNFLRNKNDVYLFDDNPNLKINKSIKKKTLNFKKLLKTKTIKNVVKLICSKKNFQKKVIYNYCLEIKNDKK